MIEVNKSPERPHSHMGHDPKLIQIADLQHSQKIHGPGRISEKYRNKNENSIIFFK